MPEGQTQDYQHGFAAMHRAAMYDAGARAQKAAKALAVMADHLARTGQDARALSLLDIGCSTGFMTAAYAGAFGRVTGIDIDAPAVAHARARFGGERVAFEVRDSLATGFPDGAFDAVACTQIYEHVPEAGRLMAEIRRVLRPGGFCYFAAGNRVQWIEPHYGLPLLSVVPKALGHRYIRWAGKAERYYETHRTLWGLRRLVRGFEVRDYTAAIVRDPVRYHATEMVAPGTWKQRAALLVLALAYWACPSYVWILVKPADRSAGGR